MFVSFFYFFQFSHANSYQNSGLSIALDLEASEVVMGLPDSGVLNWEWTWEVRNKRKMVPKKFKVNDR